MRKIVWKKNPCIHAIAMDINKRIAVDNKASGRMVQNEKVRLRRTIQAIFDADDVFNRVWRGAFSYPRFIIILFFLVFFFSLLFAR